MNSNITLAIFAILSIMTLVGATATYVVIQADASSGGPKGEKNYGKCKEEFKEKVCKKFHTGSG